MRFAKLHALGNDFLVVEDRQKLDEAGLAEMSRRLCDRHTGVGAWNAPSSKPSPPSPK